MDSDMNQLNQLEQSKPEAAGMIKAIVFDKVKEVEKTMGDAAGREKQIAALQMTYDALDLLIGAPGPVDLLVKNFVIPALPGFIDWAVAELKKAGVL